MRVRIATEGFYPDGMASTNRIHCYAKALKDEEHAVEVVSCNSEYKIEGKGFLYNGIREDINFKIIWNREKIRNKFIIYTWQEVKAIILAFYNLFTFWKYDVLFLYQGAALPRLFLILVLKVLGKKVILELNEFPYATSGSKFTRIKPVNKFLKWITINHILTSANGVICISESLKALVQSKSKKVKVLKVPILIGDISFNTSEVKSVKNFLDNNELYIFHAGSLSEQKDGIIEVIKGFVIAAKNLDDKGLKLNLLITNNKTVVKIWNKITQILQDSGLEDRLHISGFLSKEELNYCLSNASALVINKPSNNQNKYNFPTKIGDYMVSQTPVIVCAKELELNRFLFHNKNALVLNPNDVTGISKSISDIVLDKNLALKIGEQGKKAAINNFYFKVHSDKISTFLRGL